VCEQCFGPLEVALTSPISIPTSATEEFAAGFAGVFVAVRDFCPSMGRSRRSASKPGLTPLVRLGDPPNGDDPILEGMGGVRPRRS